jgi:hypothetical protein
MEKIVSQMKHFLTKNCLGLTQQNLSWKLGRAKTRKEQRQMENWPIRIKSSASAPTAGNYEGHEEIS